MDFTSSIMLWLASTEPESRAGATSGSEAGSSACFSAFLGQGQARRPSGRGRARMVAASLVAHGLLVVLGVAVSFWHVDELTAPAMVVTFLTAPTPPPPPPPAIKPSSPRRPRAVRSSPTALVQPPRPQPAPAPMDEEPEASDAGVAEGVAGGVVGGQVGGVLPPPPDPNQRRSLLARYLSELFRSRIAARFRMPPEAEREGIEGVVVMRVAIDGGGRLIELHLVGSCQHAVLCEAASRTLLASAPFPPPPAELGGRITIDVPLSYRLE